MICIPNGRTSNPFTQNTYQFRRLIAFAHENARHVVVEGVENELDREILVDSGVAWAQGIRFSWRSPAAA